MWLHITCLSLKRSYLILDNNSSYIWKFSWYFLVLIFWFFLSSVLIDSIYQSLYLPWHSSMLWLEGRLECILTSGIAFSPWNLKGKAPSNWKRDEFLFGSYPLRALWGDIKITKISTLLVEQLTVVTCEIILTSLSAHVLCGSRTPKMSPCIGIF